MGLERELILLQTLSAGGASRLSQVLEALLILHLAPGEPSYLPDGLFIPPRDQAHLDQALWLQGMAINSPVWKIMVLLMQQPDWYPVEELAAGVEQPLVILLTLLWRLVENRLLQERVQVTGVEYRLVANPHFRLLATLLNE